MENGDTMCFLSSENLIIEHLSDLSQNIPLSKCNVSPSTFCFPVPLLSA
jgi:hypothetical protein